MSRKKFDPKLYLKMKLDFLYIDNLKKSYSNNNVYLTYRFILCLSIVLCLFKASKGQILIDTIITNKFDTIACQITLVNNYNIFFKKKNKAAYLARTDVTKFILNSKGVDVQPEDAPTELKTNEYKEENGIIFSSVLDSQPKFENGQADLYRYLERTVRVKPRDVNIFGDNAATVCYSLTIWQNGQVSNVKIEEPSQGFDMDSRFLEEEIRTVIESMPLWKSAISKGEDVMTKIYFPIKFYIEMNQINILPSKYLYVFKHRKN